MYSEEEKIFVKEKAILLTDKQLVNIFNDQFGKTISFVAMRKLRQRLGVVKKHGRPKKVDI